MIVIGAEAVLSVIQPVAHVAVVVGVDVLSLSTLHPLLDFPLILLAITEKVYSVTLQSVLLPLTGVYVTLSVVVDSLALTLQCRRQLAHVFGIVRVFLLLHAGQKLLRTRFVDYLLLDFVEAGLVLP